VGLCHALWQMNTTAVWGQTQRSKRIGSISSIVSIIVVISSKRIGSINSIVSIIVVISSVVIIIVGSSIIIMDSSSMVSSTSCSNGSSIVGDMSAAECCWRYVAAEMLLPMLLSMLLPLSLPWCW
jgi:hypothetical protein